MKKEILILGIICLFIGVGIQPAFANENIPINRPSENIEDCNCEINDNFDIVRIKSLLNRAERMLNRVEIFTKLMPLLYKDNPEVIEKCEELSGKIITIKENIGELNTYWDFPIICVFLDILENIFWKCIDIFVMLYEKFYDYPTLWEFFYIFYMLFLHTWGIIYIIMMLFNCPQTPV